MPINTWYFQYQLSHVLLSVGGAGIFKERAAECFKAYRDDMFKNNLMTVVVPEPFRRSSYGPSSLAGDGKKTKYRKDLALRGIDDVVNQLGINVPLLNGERILHGRF